MFALLKGKIFPKFIKFWRFFLTWLATNRQRNFMSNTLVGLLNYRIKAFCCLSHQICSWVWAESQILRLGCPLGDILSKLFPPSSLVHYSKTNYVVTQQLGPAVVHLQYKLLLFSVLLMECDATEIQYINSLFFPRGYFLSYNFKYINRGGH